MTPESSDSEQALYLEAVLAKNVSCFAINFMIIQLALSLETNIPSGEATIHPESSTIVSD